TSASSPWLAGAVALAAQRKGGPVGNPNPALYAAPTATHGVFDVTEGFNGVNAGQGYDNVTGLGSIKDVSLLIGTLAPGDPPARLSFTTQPKGGLLREPLPTQPVVVTFDRQAASPSGFNGPVTVLLKPGSG